VDEPDPPDERLTLVGFTVAARPEGAEAERDIVPAKLLRLDRLMVDVPELPVDMVTVAGMAEMEKSPTPTVTVVAWDSGLLEAVIVTV